MRRRRTAKRASCEVSEMEDPRAAGRTCPSASGALTNIAVAWRPGLWEGGAMKTVVKVALGVILGLVVLGVLVLGCSAVFVAGGGSSGPKDFVHADAAQAA